VKKSKQTLGKTARQSKVSNPSDNSAPSRKKATTPKMLAESQKLSEKTLASTDRLEGLLAETDKELASLEPRIERLQRQVEKLHSLRLQRQKLIAFKLSVKSILSGFTDLTVIAEAYDEHPDKSPGYQQMLADSQRGPSSTGTVYPASYPAAYTPVYQAFDNNDIFIPEMAFNGVSNVLRRKETLNYELFRAVVLNGGRADSHAVKQYLVEHDVRLPGSGERFDAVPLSNIASRLHYLVRKGIIAQESRGSFVSRYGWQRDDAEAG
jgi:hypothetical protein